MRPITLLTLAAVASVACSRFVKTPPTLLLENATVILREKTFERIGKRSADVHVYQLGHCYKPTGRPCEHTAAEDAIADAPLTPRGFMYLVAAEANCAGDVGVWHLLIKCLTNLVGDYYDVTKTLPDEGRRAALVVVNDRDGSGCRFGDLFEAYRPLFETFFVDGVHRSLECYRADAAGDSGGRSYRHVLARTRAVGQGMGRLELLPALRRRGYEAYGVEPPAERVGPARVLHLTRDDEGLDAHRSIGSDGTLEDAFRQAGAAAFVRCCDWGAAGAAATAVATVASADIIVGAHGAAMTHVVWAKPTAIVVELYSGALLALRRRQSSRPCGIHPSTPVEDPARTGLWFFRPMVKRHGARFGVKIKVSRLY